MRTHSYTKVVRLLNSVNWTEHIEGAELLKKLSKPEDLIEICNLLNLQTNGNSIQIFIRHCNDLIIDFISITEAFYCILTFVDYKEDKNIEKLAKEFCRKFLTNDSYFLYQKVEALTFSLKNASVDSSIFIINLIGQRKLSSFGSIILRHIDLKNERMMIATLKCFRQLQDKRIIKYTKKIQTKDINLQEEVIITLGEVGSTFDAYYLKKYLNEKNEKFNFLAHKAMLKLKKDSFLREFFNYYKKSLDEHHKAQLINAIKSLYTKKSLLTLIKIVEIENTHDFKNRAIWAIYDYPSKLATNSIINHFSKVDDNTKIIFLQILGEIQTPECYRFIIATLKRRTCSILVIHKALEVVTKFNQESSLAIIETYMEEDINSLNSYLSISSILAHDNNKTYFYIQKFLKMDLPADSLIHQLILKSIYDRSISTKNKEEFKPYLLQHIQSNIIDVRYLSILCLSKIPEDYSLKAIIECLKSEEIDINRSECIRAIGKIINKNNSLLEDNLLRSLHGIDFKTLELQVSTEFILNFKLIHLPKALLDVYRNEIFDKINKNQEFLFNKININTTLQFLKTNELIFNLSFPFIKNKIKHVSEDLLVHFIKCLNFTNKEEFSYLLNNWSHLLISQNQSLILNDKFNSFMEISE